MTTTSDPALEAFRAVDEAATRFLVGRHIPGVAYAVVLHGALIHVGGIGTLRVGDEALPDADSVFRIASMTKSFTAATILSLRDDGLLALDDPVATHVPELAGLRGPTADAPAITLRHLLTMEAGFPTDDPWGDRQQGLDLDRFVELLRAGPRLAWTPGVRFEYSNLGYGILGRVISNVAGSEYRDVVQERLLAPLEMTATTFSLEAVPPEHLAHGYLWRDDAYVEEPYDPYGALAAMGGIYTSLRDLARWVGFFTDAFPPRDDPEGSQPLSRASRREMQQSRRAIPPWLAASAPDVVDLQSMGYGYGLDVIDDLRAGRIVGHSGGYPGFGSHMRWQPTSGLGVVVLANHRYAPATPLGRDLMRTLLGTSPAVAAPRRIVPAPATVDARAVVESLLDAWDDTLAADTFAMNVDLDEPLTLRRAEVERLRRVHGRLEPDPDEPTKSLSSFDLTWWMRGERGRVRVELLMSPEPDPRIQALNLTSAPEPHADATAFATVLVRAISDGPWGDLPAAVGSGLSESVDRVALERAVRTAGARFGTVRLGPVTAGTETSATWRVLGERGELTLRVDRDPVANRFTAVELLTAEAEPPVHGD
jgi:CubicO group peptidase (beta-lactamase class C family)